MERSRLVILPPPSGHSHVCSSATNRTGSVARQPRGAGGGLDMCVVYVVQVKCLALGILEPGFRAPSTFYWQCELGP